MHRNGPLLLLVQCGHNISLRHVHKLSLNRRTKYGCTKAKRRPVKCKRKYKTRGKVAAEDSHSRGGAYICSR